MTVAKQIDIRANIKKYFDMAFNGEPVIVPRKENKNVVIISEKDYKELEKARNNAAYLKMLDKNDGRTWGNGSRMSEITFSELLINTSVRTLFP